ncbi:MAG TPA: response regulator [Methylomirabilota bacterium]|nr:response regulator [Methylomirabilota bacterium]
MKKVLVIEDDLVAATGYGRLLQANGFAVASVRDGAAGLRQLAVFRPDAVILDLMLPKVSGLDVLRAIRADSAFRELPILMVTNACLPIFVSEALEAGANRIFDKSNDTALAIIGVLHDLLRTSSDSRLVVPTNTGNPDICFDTCQDVSGRRSD